jgi:hypothetical protein
MYTFILALPFAVWHYLAVLNYKKNGVASILNDEFILEIIQLICTVVLAVIIRKRSKDVLKDNSNAAGKYTIIFSAAFILVLILYLTNVLCHICFRVFHSIIFNDMSGIGVFASVFVERIFRGELLAEIMLCLTICFFGKPFRLQVKNQVQ